LWETDRIEKQTKTKTIDTKMDVENTKVVYRCDVCRLEGAIHVEVEPEVQIEDKRPERIRWPSPWGMVPYACEDDEGAMPWDKPDGRAEREAMEAIKVSLIEKEF
jgi:hypothetical protein